MGGQYGPQTVTFQVQAFTGISVSGHPGALVVNSATPGSAPNSASDSSTTRALTTNESNRKIAVAIHSTMPSGTVASQSRTVTLTVTAG